MYKRQVCIPPILAMTLLVRFAAFTSCFLMSPRTRRTCSHEELSYGQPNISLNNKRGKSVKLSLESDTVGTHKTRRQITMLEGKTMAYDDLKNRLNEYNWDDGFKVPREILADADCDLALALEVFYLADGYRYLERSRKTTKLQKWNRFITVLYDDIVNHKFPKTDTSFEIPLSKVQKYKLRKIGIAEIFLTDL